MTSNVEHQLIEYVAIWKTISLSICEFIQYWFYFVMQYTYMYHRFYLKLHKTPNPFNFLHACIVIGLEVLTMIHRVRNVGNLRPFLQWVVSSPTTWINLASFFNRRLYDWIQSIVFSTTWDSKPFHPFLLHSENPCVLHKIALKYNYILGLFLINSNVSFHF